jgi:anti-anti-sigma factor
VLDYSPTRLTSHCSLRIERHLDTTTVWLTGEFDLACEKRFLEALWSESALSRFTETLVIDLQGLRFIDSTGLRLLLQIDAASKKDGFDFVVLCGNGAVRRVFEATGLESILRVAEAPATEAA